MKRMTMEKLVTYCNQYGFIYQGSEIYGGLANTWDYGPLGSQVKNNLKNAWRKKFIQQRKNSYEIDANILMHPSVWQASGHIAGFCDPLIDCKECKMRFRADNLIQDSNPAVNADTMSETEMDEFIEEHKIACPNCHSTNFTKIKQFNLMFKTQRGVTEEKKTDIYLRPENAQGEYVNYLNVLRSSRSKLPFSIGQIGKAFRNEVTPRNFTFRTIEFEQMEYQTFCHPNSDNEIYEYYKNAAKEFYCRLGINPEKLRYHDHEKLAFYAKSACDIEYEFDFGWGEINGSHNRTDYDLMKHQEYAGVTMEYLDPTTNEKYIPYIIESTMGVDRSILAILFDAYHEEELEDGSSREVLKIHPFLAPYKIAVLPLIKKRHATKANQLFEELANYFMVTYDETASIGKRYRRQDVIGTPFCITIDDTTLESNVVTIRDRDTMQQVSISIDKINDYISKRIQF